VTARLYHFTCSHGAARIGNRGHLEPQAPHPMLGCSVIWLTTEGHPDPELTGLTSRYTKCDRLAFRYVVTDLERCRPWLGSPERDAAPAGTVADLERYGAPEQWWITDGVRARLA
jgi:hypothetical protein